MKPLRQQIVVEVKDRELKELRSELRKQSREGKEAATGLSRAFDKAGAKIKIGMAAAFTAVTVALVKLSRETAAFSQGLARVGTLGDAARQSIGRFRQGLLDLYKEGPQKLGDLTAALYQTISAGIDASKAMGVLRVAMRAATGDGSDVATAVDGITSAIKGFGKEAEDAEDVADAFFVAVQDGKTTFGELSSQIGEVAGPANALGISLEQILASIAALTQTGLSTPKSVTQISAILNAFLSKADELKAMGVDIADVLGKRGMQGALEAVAEAAKKAGKPLQDLLGSDEAVKATLILTGAQANAVAATLDNMASRAGKTTQAFKEMRDETQSLAGRVMNNLNAKFIELGTTALPLVNKVLQKSLDLLERFDSPVEKLLSSLKDLEGADPKIVARLEIVAARQSAVQARQEAMAALEDMEIVVDFKVENSTLQRIKDLAMFAGGGMFATDMGREAAGNIVESFSTGFITDADTKKILSLTERQLEQIERETTFQLQNMYKRIEEAFGSGRGTEGMKLKLEVEVLEGKLRKIDAFRKYKEDIRLAQAAIDESAARFEALDAEAEHYAATVSGIADEYREVGSVLQAVSAAARELKTGGSVEAPRVLEAKTKPAEPLSPEALARIEAARDALEAVQRAQDLANAGTQEQARLLAEVYEAEDQVKQIKEAQLQLGKTAVAGVLAEAEAREKAARAALAEQGAIREAVRIAATKTEAAVVTLLPKTDPATLAAAVREEMERLRAVLDNQVALIEATITPEVSSEAKAQAEEEIAGLQAETEAALRRVLDLLRKEAPEVAQLLGTAFQDALGGLSTSGEAERRLKSDVERLQRDLARLVEPLEIELAIPDLPEDRRRAVVEEVARLKEAALAQLRALYEAAAEDAAAFSTETREALKRAFEDLDVDPGEVRGVLAEIDAVIRPFEAERLNLKVRLALEEIDEAAFEEAMKAAGESAKAGLQAVFEKLPPSLKENEQLMQALAEAIENVENAGERAGKSVERVGEGMQDLASGLRAVTRLADVFGDLSEGAKDLVGSLAEVLDGMGRLQEIRSSDAFKKMGTMGQIGAQAVPVIGMAAGIVGAIEGFTTLMEKRGEQAREEARAMQDLRDALLEGARRFERAVEEMLKAARPGHDVSGEDAAKARQLLEDGIRGSRWRGRDEETDAGLPPDGERDGRTGRGRTSSEGRGPGQQPRDSGRDGTPQEFDFSSFIQNFVDLGILTKEMAEQFGKAYENLLNQGYSQEAAFDKILAGRAPGLEGQGLQEIVDGLAGNLGGFGESVDGAIAALDFFTRYVGQTGEEAIDRFVESLEAMSGEIGVSDQFGEYLREIATLNLDDEADRTRYDDILKRIAETLLTGSAEERKALLGGLSAEELEQILETLAREAERFSEVAGAGADSLDDFMSAADRAYKAFDVLTRFFEEDAPAAFERFAELFLEGETGLNDAGKTLLQEAQRLASGGLTTDAERERMREIGRMFAEELLREQNLFGLSDEDAERLASLLMTTSASSSDEGSEYSLRRQFDRSITEVQANEVIAVLYGQHATLRSMLGAQQAGVELLGKIHAALSSASTNRAAPEVSASKGTIPALAYRPASDDLLRQALAADYHAAQVPLVRSVQTLAGGQQAQYETSTSVFRDERSWQHSREFTDARETQTEEGDKIEVHLTQHFHGLPDERHVRDVARAVREQVVEEVQQLRRRAY